MQYGWWFPLREDPNRDERRVEVVKTLMDFAFQAIPLLAVTCALGMGLIGVIRQWIHTSRCASPATQPTPMPLETPLHRSRQHLQPSSANTSVGRPHGSSSAAATLRDTNSHAANDRERPSGHLRRVRQEVPRAPDSMIVTEKKAQ
mmetsp:Transcript_9941/g.28708  ORF Transcript_9941/g.28708 Transcript_9941/m.28708 type:complete len:146 (+) Transcript_9941:411-848(+)